MNINLASARAHWIGAALLSLSFGLSGCGGGGGGPSVAPTPTPTPRQISTNNQCSNGTYAPNYRNDPKMDADNPLVHWSGFPVRVYFKTDGAYTAARQSLAVQGFNRWVTATGSNGVTYQVVNSADKANVVADFYIFTGGAGDRLGYTTYDYDTSTNIILSTSNKPTQIHVGITGSDYNDLLTAAHEFGHALGINGHSADKLDLMFFEGNDQYGGAITTRDLNTMLRAYCGDFNKNLNARTAPASGNIKSVIIE